MCEKYKNYDNRKAVKNAYKARLETELKTLSVTNPELAEKAKVFYEEANKHLANKLKRKLIIWGIITFVFFVLGFICLISEGIGAAFGLGIGFAVFWGGIAALYMFVIFPALKEKRRI